MVAGLISNGLVWLADSAREVLPIDELNTGKVKVKR